MIEILIASLPDREWLVAELWIDNHQLAEINQEQEVLMVDVHPRLDGKPWTISLDDLSTALNTAKDRLVGGPS